MEREILFRGKRVDNGEWIYGTGIWENDGSVYILSGIDGASLVHSWMMPTPSFYKVDPLTVGRFTGLTDKNGNNIFKGDILDDCEVVWDARRAAWILVDGWGGKSLLYHTADMREVTGNIHDNPELLEGNK